ncbi:MAG: MFS transporter [Anaerolineae bacterium]|nr:MFS transporter [Anaerolineae bacterium]MDW8072129.1 MFS transporter [Anaerolineae bacterium]
MNLRRLLTVRQLSHRSIAIAQTAGYYGGYFIIGIFVASLGPTLPGLAQNTGSSVGGISFLFLTRSFGYLLGSLLCGRLYDRLPIHTLMGSMLLVIAALLGVTPLIPTLWLLTLVQLILGLSVSTLDIGINASLMWVHRARSGAMMTAGHFFFGAGGLLTPVLVTHLAQLSGGVCWSYWAIALVVLPFALWVFILPNPTRAVERTDADLPLPVNRMLVFLVTLFLFLYVGVESSFGGWIFTYARTLQMGNDALIAYLNSTFYAAFTVGCLIATPLAMRLRPRYILLGDLLGCLTGLAVILMQPHSLVALWGGTLIAGLAIASIFPVTLGFAERRLAITGSVTGWFFSGAGAGGMILPWLIGQLFEVVGPLVAMYGMVCDLLIALVILFALMRFEPAGDKQHYASAFGLSDGE